LESSASHLSKYETGFSTNSIGERSRDFCDLEDGEERWDDWVEPSQDESTMCLFDDQVFETAEKAHEHMSLCHSFNLKQHVINSGKDYLFLF
jgi:hypothetical protein